MSTDTPPSANDRFKSIVALLRDVTTIVALAGTVAFFVSPQFERFLKETFGTQAWYFATELSISTQIPDGAETGPILFEARRNNFYHFLWSASNNFPGRAVASDTDAVDYVVGVLDQIKGDIVYAGPSNRTDPTPGRADVHVTSAMRTLAHQNECFRILDTYYRKGAGSHPHNIYLKMVQTPCH